jgi:hypothetical protein
MTKEERKVYAAAWYIRNKDKVLANSKKWQKENKDKEILRSRQWRKNNPEKERIHCSNYRKENPDYFANQSAERRARKLNATPKWINEDEQFLIKEIYSLAKLRTKVTGVEWQVDHIIPLKGKLVSGLHVPMNLQVIPKLENIKKSNNYDINCGNY